MSIIALFLGCNLKNKKKMQEKNRACSMQSIFLKVVRDTAIYSSLEKWELKQSGILKPQKLL